MQIFLYVTFLMLICLAIYDKFYIYWPYSFIVNAGKHCVYFLSCPLTPFLFCWEQGQTQLYASTLTYITEECTGNLGQLRVEFVKLPLYIKIYPLNTNFI